MTVITDFYKKGEGTIYFEYDRPNDKLTIKTTADSTSYEINNASTDIRNYSIRIYERSVYDQDTGELLYEVYHDIADLINMPSFISGIDGHPGIRTIDGTHDNDSLVGSVWNDTITAGAGDDTIRAVRGVNEVNAGDGNDLIYVTNGTVTGGKGNDTITIVSHTDPWGTNVYYPTVINFNQGDGQDTIINNFRYLYNGGHMSRPVADSTINFGSGINKEDIKFKQSGNNLVILVGNGDDKITLQDYFSYVQVDGKPGNDIDTTIVKYRFNFTNGEQFIFDGRNIYNANNLNEIYPLEDFLKFDNAIDNSSTTTGQRITGTDGDDTIVAGDGNDIIQDITGLNFIDAGAGNDNITGTGTIKGGVGNDVINIKQDNSSDTIIFNVGDGKDVVNSYDRLLAKDTLRFGNGISVNDLTYKRSGNHLIIFIKGEDSGDQITLANYFAGPEYQTIAKFEFTDAAGNIINDQTINDIREGALSNYVFNFNGTAGNDNIVGSLWRDKIEAGAGNDKITGAGTIIGGEGNDAIYIQTEGSSDTIVFNVGDGQDVITSHDSLRTTDTLQFGEGISATDLTYSRSGNHLVIQVGSSGTDKITIANYFLGEEYQTLHQINFVDASGTVINSIADLRNQVIALAGDAETASTIVGTSLVNNITGRGSDSLTGGKGNDKIIGAGTITGGEGNDAIYIQAEGSSDTIVFNVGDGQDVITSHDSLKSTDTLQFGEGINAADLTYSRSGNHLVIQVGSSGTDKITIANYFLGEEYQTLHQINFVDATGNVIDSIADLRNQVFALAGDAERASTIVGTSLVNNITGRGSDSLIGGKGNDKIIGAGTITGDKGNDAIYIQAAGSSDTIHYRLGDGQDVIVSLDTAVQKGQDTIVFDDLASTNVSYERRGNNLILKAPDGGQITINNYFVNADYQTIKNIHFTDGSWSLNPDGGANGFIRAGGGATVPATPSTSTADTFTFAAGDGNKVFSSYDPYLTQDTLRLTGISSTDVTYQHRGNHLVVVVGSTGEEITLANYFVNPAYQTINKFVFDDRTINDIRQSAIDFDYSNTTTGQTIVGSPWSKSLIGGAGNDKITGAGTIIGGKGNDVISIREENSSDTLIFNKGDGKDVIDSYDTAKAQDTLELRDIALTDVSFARSQRVFIIYQGWKETYDLIITVKSTGDQITVKNYFLGEEYRTLSEILFKDSDGNITGRYDFSNPNTPFRFEGTETNDRIIGSLIAGKDYINAKEGNDVILGAGTIIGGKGDDNISIQVDGSADEIYFNLGDGKDVINSLDKAVSKAQDAIVFGNDVTVDDVVVSRQGNNLILTVGTNGDQITVNNYFAGANYQTITQLNFQDGSYWILNPKGGEYGLVTKHNTPSALDPVAPFSAASLYSQADSLTEMMSATFAPASATQNMLADEKTLDLNSAIAVNNSH